MIYEPGSAPRTIYVVDDDISNKEVLEHIFLAIAPSLNLCFFDDSAAFLDLISKDPPDLISPDLIIIDINMPCYDGIEVLKHLRALKKYSHTPILICSTSRNPKEVAACYHEKCNGFFVKRSSLSDVKRDLMNITKYWFETICH